MKSLIALIVLVVLVTLFDINEGYRISTSNLIKHRFPRAISGLYSTTDDVEILTTESFNKEVYGSQYGWLVEFYASWCGYCQRLAPVWKSFATNVSSWSDMVKIAVVDCSNPGNTPVCRKYNVLTYPTLRYFHENFLDSRDLEQKIVKDDESVEGMKTLLIKQIRKEQIHERGSVYPNLLAYEDKTLETMFNKGFELKQEYGFLVFENFSGPYFGAEVALDFHLNKAFQIVSVFNNNTDIINLVSAKTVPSVYVVNFQTKQTDLLLDNVKSQVEIHDGIKNYLETKNIEVHVYIKPKKNSTDEDGMKNSTDREALRHFIKKMGDVVFQTDLESALRYSLKYEAGTSEIISGEKLVALKTFVGILGKYFPFGEHGKKFLKELSLLLSEKESIEGPELVDLVVNAENNNNVFSSSHQWLACEGSSEKYRRYPCSLWKLFHFLTVNADEENFQNEVLLAMLGYIKNFFSCVGCSMHFQEMAAKRNLTSVWSRDNGILWLWSAHNEVNMRLSGDITEDPEYKKIQFPAPEQCPNCYNYEENRYIRQEVLNYLKRVYGKYHVRYLGADTKILFKGLESSNNA